MQYDALAPMYDKLMSYVEYDEWIDLIKRVSERYGASLPRDILELGAGTGVVGKRLVDLGYEYIASDFSFPMCKEARTKRSHAVCVADARLLPFKKQFGMAIFLYDGINYLLTLDDYGKLFASVYDTLLPNGLFLFDITTRENSERHFENFLDFDDYGDMSYIRHSYFSELESVQYNDFTIYRRSTKNPRYYEKYVETHVQKIFSVSDIENAIPNGCFTIMGIWDGYTFRKYSNRSIRIHFLIRKNGGV